MSPLCYLIINQLLKFEAGATFIRTPMPKEVKVVSATLPETLCEELAEYLRLHGIHYEGLQHGHGEITVLQPRMVV